MLEGVAYAMGAPGGGGAAGAQGGGGGSIFLMLQVGIIFVIFYFLLIRPQQKKAKAHKAMLDGLKKGDQVITNGGIYGTIYSITPSTMTLIISENVKIKVARAYVAGLASSEEAVEPDKS